MLSVDGFSGIYGNFGQYLDSLNNIGGTGPTTFSFTCPYGLIIGIEVWAVCVCVLCVCVCGGGGGEEGGVESSSSQLPARCKLCVGLGALLQLQLKPSGKHTFISGIRFLCNIPNNC